MRFDRRIRLFGSVLFTVGSIVWLPIAVYVPALTFNQVTGVDIYVITPIVCLVCTFYTCVGGLKAVIWTDVVQSFIMFGSIFTVIIKGTMDLGGFGVVWQRNVDGGRIIAPEMTLDPTVRLSVLSVFIGGTLHKLQSTSVHQVTIQRFVSLPSIQKARQCLLTFTIGLTLLLSSCVYVGLLTYATYHDCDPLSTKLAKATDQLVPLLVMHILGVFPGLPGLFVSGVFSAALSSISTGLNSLSCVILEDFVKLTVTKPLSERQVAFILRFIVAFFGLSCIGLVFVVEKLGMVLQLATTLGAVTQGPLLGVFFMGICMPWINANSALTGSLVSFLILGWTCTRAQIALATKELRFATKPVSVEGCLYAFDNSSLPTTFIPPEPAFHHMSFLWYSAFGGALTVAVACLAMLYFGAQDVHTLDESLFAPCYFGMRFDRRIQCLGAALFIVKAIFWLPIALYVPALTFNQVTGIDTHLITPVVCGICIFYTCVGGLKAVVFTDFAQTFIIFGTMFLVIIKGTLDVGGFGVVWQRNMDSGRIEIPDLSWDPRIRLGMFSVIVGGIFAKLQILISQPVIQRCVSLPSMSAVKQSMIIFVTLLTLLMGMCCYLGMITFATYHDCDPVTTKLASAKDQLVPLLVMDVLGEYPGVAGLYVSTVFSAALSAISTILNSISAVILEDFAKPLSRNTLTEMQTAFLIRAVVVVFGVMAISMVYIVEKLGMVLQLAGTIQSITYGPLTGIFFVGVCMPWINTNSVLTGSAISSVTMAVLSIKSQLALFNKEFVWEEKPVSVEGCTYEFEHIPTLNSTLSDQPSEQEHPFYLISWICYSGLGALLTVIYSHMAIIVFSTNKKEDIDASLVTPFLRKYFKDKKYVEVEMFDKIEQKETL